MEEKEKILSDPCSPDEMNSSDRDMLLKCLAKKDAEILKLKAELASCQEQLATALSENRTKIAGSNMVPQEVEMNVDKITVVSKSVQVPEESHEIEDHLAEYKDKPMPKWNDGGDASSTSIAEILKATAIENQDETSNEAGQLNSEYIFDSNSGFYYHPATGYYWDPNSGLFYDYTSGLYYWYNEKTQDYEVHSSVDGQIGLNSNTNKVSPTTKSSLKEKRSRRKNLEESSTDTLRRKVKRKRLKKKHEISISNGMKSGKITLDSIAKKGIVNENGMILDDLQVETDLAEPTNYESDSSGSLASGESELVSDLESGELTSCSEESDVQIIEDPSDARLLDPNEFCYSEAMAEDYPPCIRCIVQESETLPIGDLYVVTCTGGSIGREESKGHALLIPDTSVSKKHAEIVYDYEEFCYKIKDLGSQNGTFLNDQRISKSKNESSTKDLSHGDVLQVGNDTKLLVHIHKGHETCDDCEPGQVQAKLKAQNQIKNNFQVLSKEEKRLRQRQELKRIKKKFGLQNSSYESPGAAINKSGYEDKAMLRRKIVGSENDKRLNEKPASVHSPITASNKGHKLLAKMGWKEGEGLGKSSSGIAEPINVELRLNQGAGLGSNVAASLSIDNLQQADKMKRWSQARKRFNQVTAESKESHNSLNQTGNPSSFSGLLNSTGSSPSTDISSVSPVSTQGPSSQSSSFALNKDKEKQHSRTVWVKGETQQPS